MFILLVCLCYIRDTCREIGHNARLFVELEKYTELVQFTVTSVYKIETALCDTDQHVYYGTVPLVDAQRRPVSARMNQNFDYGVCGGPVYLVGDRVFAYYAPGQYADVVSGKRKNLVLTHSNSAPLGIENFVWLGALIWLFVSVTVKLYNHFTVETAEGEPVVVVTTHPTPI